MQQGEADVPSQGRLDVRSHAVESYRRALVPGLRAALGPARAGAAGPLQFFKNYFITGDYAVGGASLWQEGAVNGKATAQIAVAGVPQAPTSWPPTCTCRRRKPCSGRASDRATFNGTDLGPGSSSLAKALNWELATAPCWTVGWPGGRRLVTYRADVLRFLPVGPNGKLVVGQESTGRNLADLSTWRCRIPERRFGDVDEGGTESGGGTGPRAVGASLVVVYRDPIEALQGDRHLRRRVHRRPPSRR